jgi:metal-responsive CopG/Arc/MetJ family transcriptional regulator
MKTAISLSDELFHQAEVVAKRLRISRSQLYAQALTAFLAQNNSQLITEQLNRVYSHTRAEVDPVLQSTQIDLLKQVKW